jgi:hypothetical protein
MKHDLGGRVFPCDIYGEHVLDQAKSNRVPPDNMVRIIETSRIQGAGQECGDRKRLAVHHSLFLPEADVMLLVFQVTALPQLMRRQ